MQYEQFFRDRISDLKQEGRYRVFIDIRWGGKHYSIGHNQKGERFPNYVHAQRALEVVRSQIDDGTFDPVTLADLAGELRHIFVRAVAREEIARAPQVAAVTVPTAPAKPGRKP